MDHLIGGEHHHGLQVPYLCEEMYDEGNFDGYHVRAGWDIPALSRGNFQRKSSEQASGFLQAWMYFGLLWDFFGSIPGFQLRNFVTQGDDGIDIVTTKALPYYVGVWNQRAQQKTPEQRGQVFDETKYRLRSLHNLAVVFCEGVPAGDGRVRSVWQLPPVISLSIQILADTLQHAGHEIFKGNYNIEWGYSPMLRTQMQQAGWCPRAIATCTKGQQIHNLYYASTLGGPPVQKDHEYCNEQICRWEQLDEAYYVTQHRPNCPGPRSMKGPDQELLALKYQQNKTPLVRFLPDSNTVELSNSTDTVPYVAISHVWADGMGNQHANALPLCQLRFIQHLVDQLQGLHGSGGFWWCDTLCVPVSPLLTDLRKAAIRNMRQTYADASQVLVIDSELICISAAAPVVEIYIRLKLSSWMRRLWTLQEAVLGRDVVIQFAGGVRSLNQIFEGIRQDGQHNQRSLYTRYSFLANTFFGPLLRLQSQSATIVRFIDMWKQLQWRGTSHEADEAVCLATILGLDPSPILAISSHCPSTRMAKFLIMANVIPSVLLVQPPPRLLQIGFQWAPASLLNCFRETPTNPFRWIPGVGTMDPDGKGLLMQRTGVIVLADQLEPFVWTGDPFILSFGNAPDARQFCRVEYLFDQDQGLLRSAGGLRSGRPAIIFLERDRLMPGNQGMCILGEVADCWSGDECMRLQFVGIVTILTVSSSTGAANTSQVLSNQSWLVM